MSSPIFFQVQVMDNQDPLMLGRIRAKLLIDNYNDIVKGITDPPWNEEKDKWTERDPFIFNPLMPYYMYQVPKKDEMAQVIYVDKDFKYQNQYYIQNTFSTPTATNFEYYVGGNKLTGTGTQLKTPKLLKNQDGTYPDAARYKGVFPEPGDNALLGRGSADVVIKQDEILLRAGKFEGQTLEPNVDPVANSRRGFLQLSRFQANKILQDKKTVTELNEIIVQVKYLVEWFILNPENNENKLKAYVYLYQLKPDILTNSKNLTVNSNVPNNLKILVAEEESDLGSPTEIISFINNFLKTCNESTTTKSGKQLFPDNNLKFPIFYRPNQITYSKLNVPPSNFTNSPTEQIIIQNINTIFNGVKLYQALKQGGYGLIYSKNNVGKPLNASSTTVQPFKYSNEAITYGALGSNKLFLLSQDSAIPGKGRINFNDTLYGISVEKFVDEILPKTSSSVRGEELMELISLIVRFLVTHTHAYPGLAPVPITQDGTKVDDILTQIQNAANKILNENIRIN